jgi:hypothetical protein
VWPFSLRMRGSVGTRRLGEQEQPPQGRELVVRRPPGAWGVGVNVPVWFVRFRSGVVGETLRVCHYVPIPNAGETPTILTALCGTTIGPGQADRLDKVQGMPCFSCLMHAASTVDTHAAIDGGDE